MKNKMNKRVTALTAALALVLGTAAVSAAYWTDKKVISSQVRVMNIGITSTLTDGLGTDDPYVPGDSKPFSFTVRNTGTASVDIKPVIRITSSKLMSSDASSFRIVDEDGTDVSGFDTVYLNDEGAEVAADAGYMTVEYTLSDCVTLAGSEHADSTKGEVSDRRTFTYCLKLDEASDNGFQDATAAVDISTYAIQHRNRDNQSEEWIQIAAES